MLSLVWAHVRIPESVPCQHIHSSGLRMHEDFLSIMRNCLHYISEKVLSSVPVCSV